VAQSLRRASKFTDADQFASSPLEALGCWKPQAVVDPDPGPGLGSVPRPRSRGSKREGVDSGSRARRARRVNAVPLLVLAVLLAGCSSVPIRATSTDDEQRAICERQRGWWRGSSCEYDSHL
jgi:hypothetical protein